MRRTFKMSFSQIIGIFAFFNLAIVFTGCQTEMQLDEDIDLYQFEESYETPNMEFIGFKSGDAQWGDASRTDWGQIKNTQSIRSIGSSLQFGGIAIDESYSYFGIYSFQEIQAYKNKKRYITFIEIPDFDLTYTTNEASPSRMAGSILTGLIITIPIGLPLMCQPYKTTMYMKTNANIYVYDSEIKEIVYKKNVSYNTEEEMNGLWHASSEVSKQKVYDYFASLMANEILKEYNNLKRSPLLKQ